MTIDHNQTTNQNSREMDYTSILEISASMGAAIGGWEFVKYMLNIRTNKRKEKSEADKSKA